MAKKPVVKVAPTDRPTLFRCRCSSFINGPQVPTRY
jgi:hypothetical protein